MRNRHARIVLVAFMALLMLAAGPTGAGAADSHALIQGSGSSWAANAVNQWVADVDSQGLKVVYTANGAAQGRKDYANKSTDFGVTDSPYRGKDPTTGADDSPLGRSFAYLPVVAGGTSFPYHLEVGGQLIRNLRLTGDTVAKIFTNKITVWNDPQITKDNNGRALPNIPIIPVVRTDGAGITNQFTTWLVSQHPALWKECNGGKLAPTDYFPLNCGASRGPQRGQAGSDGVMNFVKSKGANGSIAMEEYSYPLMANYPVAKVLNKSGYFTLPTQYNVAVALTKAEINMNPADPNYLTQKLDRVYVNADKRTYPLSSYVYAIIPTASDDKRMTTAKRQTVVDFLKHSICEGQSEVGPIGYSPLPVNLVQASFTQVNKVKAADANVTFDASIIQNVKDCHNPTFVPGEPSQNHLAKIAPFPEDCDRPGKGPCAANVGAYNKNPDKSGKVPKKAARSDDAAGAGAAPAAGGSAPVAAGDVAAASGAVGVESSEVETVDAGAVSTTLAADAHSGPSPVLTALVVGLLLAALALPPVVSHLAGRSGGRR